MLDITNLYAYRIEELAVGIVKAESYEDARKGESSLFETQRLL